MDPQLIVDVRENAIRDKRPDWTTAQLDLGDFQITHNEQIKYIIERKTLQDLEASVKDNRYREQKLRAMEYCRCNDAKYFLLLEGSHQFSFGQKQKLLSSCIINTMFRDDISIIYTKNLDETITFVECLLQKLIEKPDTYFLKKDNIQAEYKESLIKQKKKENTSQNCLIMQLCAVPGISIKKAEAILSTHSDVQSIYTLCSKMSTHTPKEFFKDVKGIGKVLQTSIYAFCGVDTQ